MPTAAGLPFLTGSQGLESGFNMGNRMLQQLLARRQLEQQGEQFGQQQALREQQENRLQQQFNQQQQERQMLNKLLGLDGQSNTQDSASPNVDAIKNNPFFRGAFKKRFGLDPAMETPEERESREVRTSGEKEQNKLNIKVRGDLEKELPKSKELMGRIEEAIPLIRNNPDLFGPGVGGLDFLGGPNQRYRSLKDPKKIAAFKKLSNLFAELQGAKASDFSSRALNVAFKLAEQAKASMGDHPQAAEQTLVDMLNQMKTMRQEDLARYQKAGGKSDSEQYSDNDLVVVEGPNGQETMTYGQAKALGAA